MSAVPSTPYGNRFLEFMRNTVFVPDKATVEKRRQAEFDRIKKDIEDHIKKELANLLRKVFMKNNPDGKVKINWGPKKQEQDRLKAEEETKKQEESLVKTD